MPKPDKPKRGLTRKTPLRSGKALQPGKPLARKPPGLTRSSGPSSSESGASLSPSKGLKRTPMPQRSSGISQGPPKSRAAISGTEKREPKAKAPMKRSAMKKSISAKSPEEVSARALVAARSRGLCERCGSGGGLEKAHRIGRGVGGPWTASNLLDLCSACHSYNHRHPTQAYESGQHLRSGRDPLREPVLLWKSGYYEWALLDNEGGWLWSDPPQP